MHQNDLEIGQLIGLSHLPVISLYVYIVSDGANFGSYLAIEDSRQIPNMDTERYAKVIYKV